MRNTDIYAIDPGGTTGVACLSHFDDGTEGGVRVVATIQVPGGRFGFYQWAQDVHLFDKAAAVACENFIINTGTATKSRQADPLMLAGYLEGECCVRSIPFLLQTPAQAKAFATDDKLKHLGWWNPTKGGHANDAARHLLVYMVTQVHDNTILDTLAEML